jgi:hypothetical protein
VGRFDAVRNNPQRQRFNPRLGLFLRLAIRKNTRQGRDLRNPAAVLFAVEFNGKVHCIKFSALALAGRFGRYHPIGHLAVQFNPMDAAIAFGARIVVALFFIGLAGSSLVVIISFVEDFAELFSGKEEKPSH